MALVETAPEPTQLQQGRIKGYSRGDKHVQAIKNGWRAKRLASKYIRKSIERLAAALDSSDHTAAIPAAKELLERAVGRASMAPEDAAIVADALQLQPSAVLPMLAQMLAAALQQRTIDVATSPTATLVEPEQPKLLE